MRRLVLLAVTLACVSCAYGIAQPAARAPEVLATPATLSIEPLDGTHAEAVARDVLRDRLAARGIVADPGGARSVSVRALGSRPTTLTRWTNVPWCLVSLASLGLVPFRYAREHVVELQLVDAQAKEPVRTSRRSFVVSTWTWLPFALAPAHGLSPAEEKAALEAVEREGMGRALDAALDDVLR